MTADEVIRHSVSNNVTVYLFEYDGSLDLDLLQKSDSTDVRHSFGVKRICYEGMTCEGNRWSVCMVAN